MDVNDAGNTPTQRALNTPLDPEELRYAFRLLTLTQWRDVGWEGPEDPSQVYSRVETLSVLLNIVPRRCLFRLGEVIRLWKREFPEAAYVSTEHIRETTHRFLRITQTPGFNEKQTQDRIAGLLDFAESHGVQVKQEYSHEIRVACTQALLEWEAQLSSSEQWAMLPGLVPGDVPISIEQAFVELYAVPDYEEDLGWTETQFPPPHSAIGIETMVSRCLDCCVIIGEPGCGKTTITQWIAWATQRRQIQEFDLCLVIQLSAFSSELRNNSSISLIEHFLQRNVTSLRRMGDCANCIRSAAQRSGRVLLILDGWDEIPSDQRSSVRQCILRESPNFVTIVTSRPSGLPKQIFSRRRTDYYRIAGLSPRSMQTLIERRIGPKDLELSSRVWNLISTDDELSAACRNPFVLGLVLYVLQTPDAINEKISTGQLYQRVIDWIAEYQKYKDIDSNEITGAHLNSLRRIGFRMMCEGRSPQYVVNHQDFIEEFRGTNVLPVEHSRLMNRVDQHLSGWMFLHATFAEFFAAQFLSQLPTEERSRVLDRAFLSKSRQSVWSIYCGLNEANARWGWEQAKRWLNEPDRFGQTTISLTRLLHQNDGVGGSGIRQQILEQLWSLILTSEHPTRRMQYVAAFANTAPVELVQRAATQNKPATAILELIVGSVPAQLIYEHGLFKKLPVALRQSVEHTASTEKKKTNLGNELCAILSDEANSADPKNDWTDFPEIALRCLNGLRRAQDTEDSRRLTMALSTVFAYLPTDQILNILISEHEYPPKIYELASEIMARGDDRGPLITPTIRDTLIRRLCVIQPESPRVEPILEALVGHPIRDGGQVVCDIAIDAKAPRENRYTAAMLLEWVGDRNALSNAVRNLSLEKNPGVFQLVIEMATNRAIPVSADIIELRIDEPAFSSYRSSLLSAYFHYVSAESGAAIRRCVNYFSRHFNSVLESSDDRQSFSSWELASALSRSSRFLAASIFDNHEGEFLEHLETFWHGDNLDLGRLKLICTLLARRASGDSLTFLKRTLDTCLERLRNANSDRESTDLTAMTGYIAELVGELRVDLLLSYSVNCAPVASSLHKLAQKFGWTVFAHSVFDVDGNLICDLETKPEESAAVTIEGLQPLIDELPASEKRAISSYWYVVTNSVSCNADSSLVTIYAEIQTAYGDGDDDSLIHAIYADAIPKFDAWRQSLSRARRSLEQHPGGTAFLQQLGLPKRN